jgi:4-hydroxy-tetrahydrodipicolinate synthase
MPQAAAPLLSKTLHRGVLAALATPVDGHGQPDLATFAELIEFVAERGIDGVVIGGATGEYAGFSIEQRGCLISEAAKRANDHFAVVAGIGAQTVPQTSRLAGLAADVGCRAILLPMPYFFRYQQEDLLEYSKVVCGAAKLPCLLYHLPSFTNGLELDNLVRLLESDAGFAGIKDSSGQSRHLSPLREVKDVRELDLFVGDDSLALDAISAGWDGVISGIACFLPELLVSLVDAHRAGDLAMARSRQDDLDRVIEEVVKLPIPWAVRIGLEARGLSSGPLPLPLSPHRRGQVDAYRTWCRQWLREKTWMQPWEDAQS